MAGGMVHSSVSTRIQQVKFYIYRYRLLDSVSNNIVIYNLLSVSSSKRRNLDLKKIPQTSSHCSITYQHGIVTIGSYVAVRHNQAHEAINLVSLASIRNNRTSDTSCQVQDYTCSQYPLTGMDWPINISPQISPITPVPRSQNRSLLLIVFSLLDIPRYISSTLRTPLRPL